MQPAQHAEQAPRPTIAVSVLRAHYVVVESLQKYIENTVYAEDISSILVHGGDSDYYRVMLTTSYVAGGASLQQTRQFVPVAPMSHMRDTIDRAQERLFIRAKGSRPSNILTAGYRKITQQDTRARVAATRMPLTNYFVNTIVTALQAPAWETLLERIGEDAMFHLLSETSIFVPLPNGCLCQLTGDPIVNLRPPYTPQSVSRSVIFEGQNVPCICGTKRKAIGTPNNDRPLKRRKQSHGDPASTANDAITSTTDPNRVMPADTTFLRARMFYSRPCLVPHTTKIVVGLPPKHILNRFYPSWHQADSAGQWVDPDPRQQIEHARQLAKYVFPRQYGLSSPFVASALRPGNVRSPDCLDREAEIKSKGPCKTPKRLKNVLNILEKMIWRHHKCRYKSLLHLACPSKLAKKDLPPLDSSIILELMSETSIQLQTQATLVDSSVSLNSSGRPILLHDTSQTRKQAQHKPKFAEFTCDVGEVWRYAVLVTKAVIPKTLWGCDSNFQVVMSNVKRMITARRYETFSLHCVLQNFQTSECDWLMPSGEGARKQTRVSVSDSLKRRELLEEFLFWYFDSFIIPLLKTTFYVTESSAFRNRVLYFRHDDWSTLCAPLVEKLSSDTFQKIEEREAQEILRQRRLGFSFVRLLPKETGVRPIVNLRRRVDKDEYRPGQSINQILQAAFQILTYEKDHQPERLGASVFGPNEIYSKLKALKTRLNGDNPAAKLPKLYFVKVDVQACFDTIEQTKLLGILQDLLTADSYMLQRYGTVNKAGDKVQRKYVKKAVPEDDHPHFLTYAAQLAEVLRNTIFSDQVVYPFSRKKDIIALLEEHITENIVKIGNEYYRQVVGIPQGSVLSAILCSFFYGDLERRAFRFTEDPKCVLMRLIDDWLFITADYSKAVKFYDMVSRGHPEYGCFISKDKSLVNFDHPDLVNIVDPRSKVFPWCGYAINMHDLSVTVDYGRYNDTYLQDSLTIEFGRRPGTAFAYKMMQLAKSKSHIIYNDATLNSRDAVFLNIYQNFTVLAMKMHHYLRQWRLDVRKHHAFVLKIIRQTIHFAYTSARSKTSHKLARTHNARVDLQEDQVSWLGLHAFHTVFSRKPQAYTRMLKVLSFELSLPRRRHLRRRFRSVVAEGLSTLSLLCF